MLWVLIRTVPLRWFFWELKTNVENDGYENFGRLLVLLPKCYINAFKYLKTQSILRFNS